MRFLRALLFVVLWLSPLSAEAARCADTARSGVTLHFVDRAGLAAPAETMLQTQVVDIWREANVDVRWAPAPSGETFESPVGAAGVYVIVLPEIPRRLAAAGAAREGLAIIRFSEGQALRHVYASVGAVNRVLTRDLARPRLGMLPPAVLEQGTGRALGRAVAHEIGHYLTNSPAHAPRGLMRAWHRSSELVARDLYPFRVDLPIDENASCAR
jgi:hypothetical protein